MANIYLKKVDSSSRSEWISGNSYVVGDRVYLASATLQSTYWNDGSTLSASWRTFVCLADNSSTTSPEDDSTNWIEAGISKEYPYHCIGGDLNNSSDHNEIYLEQEATRWSTQSLRGAGFYHLRRGESQFSLGKLIIVSDTPNPVFIVNKDAVVIGFSIEPDPSIERFSIVCMDGGRLGSNGNHNDDDSQYGKIDKCDIYFSGNNTMMFGKIYDNLNKIEFTDCLFSEQASKVGYTDCTAAEISITTRAFLGFKRCSFFFPSIPYAGHFIWDSQAHSTGVESFITSCSIWFKSISTVQFLTSIRAGTRIEDNIFYFSESDGQEIRIINNPHNNLSFKNNILYIGDNSATFDYANVGEDYSEKFKNIDPQFILTDDDPSGMRLRPSSALIGGGLSSSKFPADAVWMQEGSGTGTGTESDPYYFSQFTDALIAAVSTNSKQVVCKDGAYRFTTGGEHFRDVNLGSVTFIAENRHKAALSAERGVNPGSKSSFTLKLKDFKLTIGGSEHFIHTQFFTFTSGGSTVQIPSHLTFDNCYINFETFMGLQPGSSLIAKSCIIEKAIGISATSYFASGTGASGLYTNCTFIDRNDYTITTGWNHNVTAGMQTFRNCIFRTENTSNAPAPGNGTFTQCIAYNYNTSNYSDTEVLGADPLMVNFDISSHEDSDYRLRPTSPGIGGIKPDASNAYYLQPGNPYNGDGSQKDASAMVADGDPGPFNSFTAVRAAAEANNIPYGSNITIVNGDYSWPSEFNKLYNSSTIDFEMFHYHAESKNEVSFDAQKSNSNYFGAQTLQDGVKRDTSFTGITFKNLACNGGGGFNRCCFSFFGQNGFSRISFESCNFIDIIQTGGGFGIFGIPQSGGGIGPAVSIINCQVSFAFDQDGALFGYYSSPLTNWRIENSTFVNTAIGESTYNLRNASTTTYTSFTLFHLGNHSTSLLKNNIFYANVPELDGSPNRISVSSMLNKMPVFSGNLFFNISGEDSTTNRIDPSTNSMGINPLFVDPAENNFSLRPNSPLIGKG